MLRKLLQYVMGSHNSDEVNSPGEVTVMLRRMACGEDAARLQLTEKMYPELKRLAELRMRGERADHTLQPTALVNEFFLEIARSEGIEWRDRKHFLAVASQAMRRFLIDYARAHRAQRRGGGGLRLQLEEIDLPANPSLDTLVIGELLDRLAAEEPRMAQVVEMRCFGGLTYSEIAEVLEIDERTAKRDWQVARAWLYGQLQK